MIVEGTTTKVFNSRNLNTNQGKGASTEMDKSKGKAIVYSARKDV